MITIKLNIKEYHPSPDLICVEPRIDIENYIHIEAYEEYFLQKLIPEIKKICEEMENY